MQSNANILITWLYFYDRDIEKSTNSWKNHHRWKLAGGRVGQENTQGARPEQGGLCAADRGKV
ncbi:MAG: hypothetical protein JW891_18445 [Candidatus Lokiarchaeota archaeon]|nr:hypothetical protein [Candidatus Lokiarchaeota archaeon]